MWQCFLIVGDVACLEEVCVWCAHADDTPLSEEEIWQARRWKDQEKGRFDIFWSVRSPLSVAQSRREGVVPADQILPAATSAPVAT